MISWKNIFYGLGILLLILAGLMLIPAMVDLCQHSDTFADFIVAGIFCCFLGGVFYFSCKTDDRVIFGAQEGVLLIILTWFSVPLLAALPFAISSFQLSMTDCIFEATSLVTTSGASAIYDVKDFSDGFLLWRSILQMFGGIFYMFSCLYAFSPLKAGRVFAPEHSMPLDYKFWDQLKKLLLIYLSLSFLVSLWLMSSGMSILDSLCYSLAALSTGGAIPDNNYSENLRSMNWLLPILMIIGGCSITTLTNIFDRKNDAFDHRQFRYYLALLLTVIVLAFSYAVFQSTGHVDAVDTFEKIFFLTVSSITTTGMGPDLASDFDQFLAATLYVVGFIGGCYGSCGGGVKIFRLMIILSLIKSYFIKSTHKNVVHVPTYAGHKLTGIEATALISYFACGLAIALVFSLLLCGCEMNFSKALGAVMTSMNNNGPFWGLHRATASELATLGATAKIILVVSMVAGRVDFVLLIMVITRSFWRK
ncbi:MAG: hypothetical protein LBJ16_02470 [Holosporaceae bacterium]|jgi:trk system potassium uptake protein TrkH|nr:hypothetical protein [Holosporaceae bacterium]